MSLYTIGDIHGCYKEINTLINKLVLKNEDQLIFLGDYIDRGLNSKQVIDFLIELDKKHNCIFLRGNHEQMFLDFIKKPTIENIFIYNGGHKTLKSYQNGKNWDIPDEHVKFLNNTKLWYETDDYFFVHAGVPNKSLNEITKEDEDILLWVRDEFLNNEGFFEKMIIHGHTPTKTRKVEFKDYRINIDTGCVFGGRLTCLKLPENKVIYIEKIL